MTVAAVVDALLDAMQAYDADALRALCSPDLRHWLSITEQEQGLDELLALVKLEREAVAHASFEVRRRLDTGQGAVLMLTVDGTTGGGASFHIPVCVVVEVEDGVVVRIDEYANVEKAAGLLAEIYA